MPLTKGYARNAGTDAIDARFMEAGRLTRALSGSPRLGMLYNPRSDGLALLPMGGMGLFVSDQIVLAVSRGLGDGVTILVNSGGTTVTVAAPTSNSWYAVVWAKQNDSTAGDANSTPTLGVAYSQAAAVPQLNTAVIPTGALVLGNALIPAGAASTSSAGVVVTTTAPFTSMQGGVIRYRSASDLAADAGLLPNGTLGQVDNAGGSGGLQVARGGAWLPLLTGDGSVLYTEAARTAATVNPAGTTTLTITFTTANPQLIDLNLGATLFGASSFAGNCTFALNGTNIGTARRYNNRASNAPYNLNRHAMAMSVAGTNTLVVTLSSDSSSSGAVTVAEAQLEVFAG
jgi:hypothetical protein